MSDFCLCWDNRDNTCDGCSYKPITGKETGVHSIFTWTKECAETKKKNNIKHKKKASWPSAY